MIVGTALVVCFNYNLDILHQILDALDQSRPKQGIGKFITALLISGGSSAVFRVYSNLGIRNPAQRKQKAQEMRQAMVEVEDNASENDTTETQSQFHLTPDPKKRHQPCHTQAGNSVYYSSLSLRFLLWERRCALKIRVTLSLHPLETRRRGDLTRRYLTRRDETRATF